MAYTVAAIVVLAAAVMVARFMPAGDDSRGLAGGRAPADPSREIPGLPGLPTATPAGTPLP